MKSLFVVVCVVTGSQILRDFHGRALIRFLALNACHKHQHCVLTGSVVSFRCEWIKDSLLLYCNEAGPSEILSTSTPENPNLRVTDHIKLNPSKVSKQIN